MSDGPFRPRGETPPPPPPRAPADAGPDRPGPRHRPGPPKPPRHRPGPPKPPAGIASQTTWILGVVVVLVLAYITINTMRSEKPGSRGVQPGTELPPFAAPIATSTLEGDANVLVKRSKGVPRACDVRGPRIVNSCQLAERGPSVIAFLATRSQACVDEIDTVDRVRRRFPGVQFAAVAIRGDRSDVRRLVRTHRWGMPVAYDHDGAVANAYAIAVCPTITFARRGGKVTHTTLGGADEAELVRQLRRIAP